MKFQRIYHPWNEWEEVSHNMWGEVSDKAAALQTAIEFTGNAKLYGSYMMRVVNEWPISCENALTDSLMNRRAWLGHAACALALKIPEDIIRQAWGFLTDEQKHLANAEAERAIQCWESRYAESKGLCEDMGGQMLFGWNTG